MVNPNKHIRKAAKDQLEPATSVKVYDKHVPKNAVIPSTHIIVRAQSKREFARAKDVYEWSCSVTIDVVSFNEKGYNSTVKVDDLEEKVLEVMDNFTVPGFKVKFTRLLASDDLSYETPTATVDRTVMTFESWLNKVE